MRTILLSALLTTPCLLAAEPLYTQEGTDVPFAAVLERSGIKPGTRFSKVTVTGSRIDVNNELLAKQVGETGPIPQDIGLHTQASGAIDRKDFAKWTRWYQEDGTVQVFRLFEGEQSVRDGIGEGGKSGRVETYSGGLTVAPGTWREWEGTYTIIKPVQANIFQLFHGGKDKNGNAILWPFHIRMSDEGNIYFKRRRSKPGLEDEIVIAENMVGKSHSIKVRANGSDYEVYQKSPLDKTPWRFVTQGFFMGNKDSGISFRWGMYCGSKMGISIKKDALLFVTGVTIR